MIIFTIKKVYKYGIVRGTDGHREGWFIVRKRLTPLLRIPYGKVHRINHLWHSKEAALEFLNKGNIPDNQIEK